MGKLRPLGSGANSLFQIILNVVDILVTEQNGTRCVVLLGSSLAHLYVDGFILFQG